MATLLSPVPPSVCPVSCHEYPVSSARLSASPGTIPEEQLQTCGASDCLMATASTNSTRRPSQDLIYTLMGIYTGMCRPQEPGQSKTNAFQGQKDHLPRARMI